MLSHKAVKSKELVYVVEFQDEMVEGHKFLVRELNTTYMGFHASPFERYYESKDIALKVANDFNLGLK